MLFIKGFVVLQATLTVLGRMDCPALTFKVQILSTAVWIER